MAVFHQPDAKIFLNVLDALKISLETMHKQNADKPSSFEENVNIDKPSF